MYRNNEFHNFQHASHVVMSVTKYLHRINTPIELEMGKRVKLLSTKDKQALHEHNYGIASDPITHFACCYSALIHDLDHPGVPNPQFIEENPVLSEKYKGRSVAEQNSFDLDQSSAQRVRAETVPATCRQFGYGNRFGRQRAERTTQRPLGEGFSSDMAHESQESATNRKATIVIEHVIQAADVSHTMQHWHVYRQWNENPFRELYMACRAGRMATNPTDTWYEDEIGFFDCYITLSEKLRNCGVFGVSSDENLSYARANRTEWLERGREVVAEVVNTLKGSATGAISIAETQAEEVSKRKHRVIKFAPRCSLVIFLMIHFRLFC